MAIANGATGAIRSPDDVLMLPRDGQASLADPWDWVPFCPSTYWSDGGPIIERERISVANQFNDPNMWTAGRRFWYDIGFDWLTATGHTPLIAAMRAYVASKFGKEVELPDEPK